MARVVCVHGIGKHLLGEESLLGDWLPALRDGLRRAGAQAELFSSDVAMAFYGDLFRPPGATMAPGDPPYRAADVEPGLEQELLEVWWAEAARVDGRVPPPGADDVLARAPSSVQAALRALSRSRFFAGVALRAMVFDVKQTRRYLTEPALRMAARARVSTLVGPDTEVVVAHSLGSVVAYEALCAMPGHGVRALVTLGSPLGIPRLVFNRLQPPPGAETSTGRGVWPGGEGLVWTNVVDQGDVVALVKDLRPSFGARVRSVVVHNGSHAHDVTAYLTDRLTGEAVAGGMRAG